jgi:hypothetical protein
MAVQVYMCTLGGGKGGNQICFVCAQNIFLSPVLGSAMYIHTLGSADLGDYADDADFRGILGRFLGVGGVN